MLGCLPFWFRSVSAFDLSFVTTFISGSNILAIPSNPSSHPPWRWQSRRYLAVLPSEESSRATLSWELHTTKLLWSHVPIGYQWQNTEFCPNSIGQNGHPRDFVSHASLKIRFCGLRNAMTVSDTFVALCRIRVGRDFRYLLQGNDLSFDYQIGNQEKIVMAFPPLNI
jgi:hypothetical protein